MEKVVLDNGLTLLIHELHSHPLVTLDVWVNVGSANEPPELNGISHFLEHMLFKGTARFGPADIDLAIERLGGVWNAGTSKDFTHYYLTVGSEHFNDAMIVLADAITNSTLAEREMERERGVILEEYHRKQDNPAAKLYDEVQSSSYKSGPYKASVLGTIESISQLTNAQLRDYYERYYSPSNMVLVIAGNIFKEEAIAAAKSSFGDFTRQHRPFSSELQTTKIAARSQRSIDQDAQEAYLALTWPAPSIEDQDDIFAMDLLSIILGSGRTSRLYRSIRERQQLATSIHCSFPTCKHPALLTITATTSFEKKDALIPAIEAEIERLREKAVSRNELSRAKKKAVNSHYFATETARGVASLLGYCYTISGDESFEQTYLQNLAKVTAADVRRVARKYLDPAKSTILDIAPAARPTKVDN